MKPIIYDNCQLFTYNRDTEQFGIIDPEDVEVSFSEGQAIYKPYDRDLNLIIVQALNIKKASAKMLTIINREQK